MTDLVRANATVLQWIVDRPRSRCQGNGLVPGEKYSRAGTKVLQRLVPAHNKVTPGRFRGGRMSRPDGMGSALDEQVSYPAACAAVI
jgi:hypothetical protein